MIKYTFKRISDNKYQTIEIYNVLKLAQYNGSVFITISENRFLQFDKYDDDGSFLDIGGKIYTKDQIMENPEKVFVTMKNDILSTEIEALLP